MKSILLEEKEHLQEMEAQLSHIEGATIHIERICQIEAHLFEKWLMAVEKLPEGVFQHSGGESS